MPLYRPSELQEYLRSLEIAPKRGLSQNFLIDGNIVQKICDFAGVCPQDTILEIGPGPGALTEALLERGATVIAIEKDPVLARGLEHLQKKFSSLQIVCSDILKVSLPAVVGTEQAKIVANIPYHISTPILQKCLPLSCFTSCTLMMQEEVAKRALAQQGSPDFGFLSLFVQFYAQSTYGFSISAQSFFPRPKVSSAIVRFDLRKQFSHIDEQALFTVMRRAFSQKRKTLKATLRSISSSKIIEEALRLLGREVDTRPEELSLSEWVAFFERITRLFPLEDTR